MAQITIELNDQTAEGFARLLKNLEASDRGADAFQETTGELAQAVNMLTQQQQQQLIATQQQTVAIRENRQSFMEWTNTLVEFTGHMRDAAAATADWIGDKVKWAAAKTGVDLTTAALTSLAAKALGVGGPLLGAKIGAEGIGAAFEATGKKIVAIEGPASASARRLAAEINSGLSTVEEVTARTGKTLEELGLQVESNADRIGSAFDELSATAGQAGSELWDAFMAPIPIVKQTYDATIAEIEGKFAEFTRNTVENTNLITDAINEWRGLNADHVREQSKFFAQEDRLKEVRAEYRAFEADLRRQVDLRRELGEISRIASQEDLEAARQAEREKREELLRTDQWTQQARERHFERMKGFADREIGLEQEKAQKALEFQREQLEASRKFHEEHFDWLARREKEESDRRRKIQEEQLAYENEIRELRQNAAAAAQNRNIELIKARIDLEVEDERKKIDAIAELDKQAVMNRAAAETNATEDRIERARIAARTIEEIQEIELQRKIDHERESARIEREAREKSIAEARAKFQKEVDLLKEKLQAERQLQGGGTQSELGRLAGSFSGEQVREEIVRNRMQAGVRSGRNGDGRKLTEQEIRRMVIREMKSGGINQKEVQAAQIDLLQQTAVQGAQTGKFAKSTAKAIHETATNLEQKSRELENLTHQVEEIEKFIRGDSQGSGRRQAQRRGSRR